ncbi:MAG: hypothetical protein JO257_32335 [Deltaproteobacteria bacterium]|nr:hypothetical protein [Deltaproteobacteria bacterium]
MSTREDWQRRLGPLYGGAVALVHSSSWRWPNEVADDARSPGWVLAVGVPIGVIAYLAATVLHGLHVPAAVCAIVGLSVMSLASAGIVERGLVDRIDRSQARSPSTPAVLVLGFTMLVRAAAIGSVAPAHWLGAFVATALVGRWAAVFPQAIGDPILDDRSPRSLVAAPAPAWLAAAIGLALASICTLALGRAGLAAVVLATIGAFALGIDAQRRDHGLSAAVVATSAALGEMFVLLAAAAAA